jgi:hypothetical protein
MSIKKKISMSNAVNAAMDNMNSQNTRDVPLYTVWGVEADRKIGSYYAYKKTICVLDVDHCTAELPCSAVAVIAILLGDHGCNCGLQFNSAINFFSGGNAQIDTNAGFIVIDPYMTVNVTGVRWHIQGNKIILSGDFDQQKITIQYLAYEVDEKGFPLINENHVDAIAQYIEYKHSLRTRWFDPEYKIQENVIMDLRKEWNRKCRNARAEDGDPSASDMREITGMINNPLSGIGIALWKYNDIYWGR